MYICTVHTYRTWWGSLVTRLMTTNQSRIASDTYHGNHGPIIFLGLEAPTVHRAYSLKIKGRNFVPDFQSYKKYYWSVMGTHNPMYTYILRRTAKISFKIRFCPHFCILLAESRHFLQGSGFFPPPLIPSNIQIKESAQHHQSHRRDNTQIIQDDM